MVQRLLSSGDTAGTKLCTRTMVTDKKHDKKHGDEKHGGFRKSMAVLGINDNTRKENMVPFERSMGALEKKYGTRKKHGDTRKKGRHHEQQSAKM